MFNREYYSLRNQRSNPILRLPNLTRWSLGAGKSLPRLRPPPGLLKKNTYHRSSKADTPVDAGVSIHVKFDIKFDGGSFRKSPVVALAHAGNLVLPVPP